MGDFNLPHIDWSLQRPTPAPGSKLLQFITDNGLSQYLVTTTEEALIVQIKDKIGDHQAIKFSLQIEKEETAIEKTNYNYRRANFDT